MNLSLNYTSFANPKVALEITAAQVHCLKTGESVRLTNRKGEHWLLVTLHKDALGYRFAFIDTAGRERGDDILKACIRAWPESSSLAFWSLNAEAYDLTEHPLVTIAREEHVKALEVAKVASLKAQGVTHKACTYGGYTGLNVAYQRDWLCRKRLYVLGADGKWRKMAKEAYLMLSKLEAL